MDRMAAAVGWIPGWNKGRKEWRIGGDAAMKWPLEMMRCK